MKKYTQPLKTILLAIILSFGISFVYAWTGPTTTPPAGNTSAPINTSADSQYKNGALGVGGLLKGYGGLVVNGQSFFNSTSGITHVYSSYNDGTRDYGIYQWQDAGVAPVNYFQNNVGIGTTNPTAELDVNGTIKISSDIINNGYKILISPIIVYESGAYNNNCCDWGNLGKVDTCDGNNTSQYICSGAPKKCIDVYHTTGQVGCPSCGYNINSYRNIDCGTTASVSGISQ